MSYNMIDRFLRNNLDDDDYEEFSAALDSLCTPQRKPLTHKQRTAIADKFGMSMTSTFDALVSEIEAAHGITESTK